MFFFVCFSADPKTRLFLWNRIKQLFALLYFGRCVNSECVEQSKLKIPLNSNVGLQGEGQHGISIVPFVYFSLALSRQVVKLIDFHL